MKGEIRREEILRLIAGSDAPVTANYLRERLNVSRQVIVQDIAILRANGAEILATNKGYVLNAKAQVTRIFKCRHTLEEVVDEGCMIVDLGGRVEDVFVNHRIYGRIAAPLGLENRMHVEELYRSLVSGASKPLMSVTDGYHYHTVSADGEDALNKIEVALRERGFLIEN